MNFKLYIANYCPACKKVTDFVSVNNISCDIINLDNTPQETSVPIMIFPALVKGNKLIAYGCNIISYFERKNND